MQIIREIIVVIFPWILSCITIASLFRAGDGKQDAWTIALMGNFMWLIYILAASAWGLLLMNAALWYVYGRNYKKWE